ncbi:MAG: GNAT family N-acetyltransferase [Candidatus Fermentibacter sp.]|nr:GNAT family N-acetyltransferase [Candidatus Fermentibacter sp.]
MEGNAASCFTAVERTQARDRRFSSVLVVDSRSAGFLDAFTMPKRPGSGFMRFCYVIPEMRGTGVSCRLVEYCDGLLSGFGCDEILLDVRSNNARAVGFYAGRGWVVLEQKAGVAPDVPEAGEADPSGPAA